MAVSSPMLASGPLYCHCLRLYRDHDTARFRSYSWLAVQSWAGLVVVASSGRQRPACGEVSSWLDPGLNLFRPPPGFKSIRSQAQAKNACKQLAEKLCWQGY
eukprot:1323589-Rhodomonas_salina.3